MENAASTGLSHKSIAVVFTGCAGQANRWFVVCGSKLHSGHNSDTFGCNLCWYDANNEHMPDRSCASTLRVLWSNDCSDLCTTGGTRSRTLFTACCSIASLTHNV